MSHEIVSVIDREGFLQAFDFHNLNWGLDHIGKTGKQFPLPSHLGGYLVLCGVMVSYIRSKPVLQK
jgi:hypothetical protein